MLKFLLHSYGQFDREHSIHDVVWPHFDLLYVHKGKGLRLQVGLELEFCLNQGEGILIFPHSSFSGQVMDAEPVQASVQHFALEGTPENEVLRVWGGRERGFALLIGEEGKRALPDVERALELATQPESEFNSSLRRAQLTLLLGRFYKGLQMQSKAEAGAESLYQVMTWARSRHGVVRTGEMAKRAGYSDGYFRLLFEKTFKESPSQFLLRLRMNEAKRLLRESRHPIKQIAEVVGYGDVVAFHRAFARETKFSPAMYRRSFSPRG